LIELTECGHVVDVSLAVSESAMLDAVEKHAPDLIIAPMLKREIPEATGPNTSVGSFIRA
jgi:putative two-component system hydrogenase maturation factor HypX/HoxX